MSPANVRAQPRPAARATSFYHQPPRAGRRLERGVGRRALCQQTNARKSRFSSQPKATHHRRNEFIGYRRDVEGFTYATTGTIEQGFPFFRDGPTFEVLFVDCACILATLDSAKIFIERQCEEKAVNVSVGVDIKKSTAQVGEFRRRTPQVVYDEMAIAKAPMMRDEQCYRRVQMFDLIRWRRICRREMITV